MLDIEKLKQKLQDAKERNRGGTSEFKFWTPQDGRNVIRVLPPKPGTSDFYSEARVRYNVGPNKKMVTVNLDSNAKCPIKEFVDVLYKSGDKQDEALAKKMKATTRYYFNVVDKTLEEGDENYGEVMVFGCGTTIFTDILGIIVDPDYGDITDPKNGYDIIINKSGKGLDTEYKTNPRPKQTPIGIDDWEQKMVDLSIFAKPKTNEELEAILMGEEDKLEKTKEQNKPVNKKMDDDIPIKTDDDDDDDDDDIEAEIAKVLKNRNKK
jgi:hypothetical protein